MNVIINKKVSYLDLGLKDYKQSWDYQTELFNDILKLKAHNRTVPDKEQTPTKNYLLFCEHPHVYTLGKT